MLNFPNIDRIKTPQQNLDEVKAWAYQTIEQLNYEFEQVEKQLAELKKEIEVLKQK